ncbi:hypothetical protein CSUI_005166 [Cystoisospora suis]|uniref:Uncharacterized protein n=1 Tax=Cystoisospora suis TaxID=483139 RepID=A0A2C6KW47_9APIC|nr:hypothetical protein CSUI_005166 [Cystoisospora suis]
MEEMVAALEAIGFVRQGAVLAYPLTASLAPVLEAKQIVSGLLITSVEPHESPSGFPPPAEHPVAAAGEQEEPPVLEDRVDGTQVPASAAPSGLVRTDQEAAALSDSATSGGLTASALPKSEGAAHRSGPTSCPEDTVTKEEPDRSTAPAAGELSSGERIAQSEEAEEQQAPPPESEST